MPTISLESGNLVKVSSPDNFAGYKLGVYMGRCKKDGGYKVYLTDKDSPLRDLCIIETNGDTIAKITT